MKKKEYIYTIKSYKTFWSLGVKYMIIYWN